MQPFNPTAIWPSPEVNPEPRGLGDRGCASLHLAGAGLTKATANVGLGGALLWTLENRFCEIVFH
jgi:hypothetical protein